MAKFEKGKSGNPNGRPKGSRNEKTAYIRDWLVSLIGSNSKRLSDNFFRLPLKEQFRVITQVLPYVLPKQTEAKISADVDLSTLTDEQLDTVIGSILEEIKSDNGTE